MTSLRSVMLFLWVYLLQRHFRRIRTSERLRAFQQRKISSHLRWVTAHSPMYRELAGAPLGQFPIMDKASFMAKFDVLNTRGVRREQAEPIALQAEKTRDFVPKVGDLTVGMSTGTSGHRGIFLVSKDEEIKWSAFLLSKVLPGSLLNGGRIALFLRANSNLYESLKKGNVEFRFFDLASDADRLVMSVETYDPHVLISTPSMLRLLARAQSEGKFTIHPKRIYSTAEVLDPLDKPIIETAFGVRVDQIYHCTEGFLGVSCSQGTLHINEDIVHVEKQWLDIDQRRFVPIITDFERKTQPIIRYRLNDILCEKQEPCRCGSPFLAIDFVEGREDDQFIFATPLGSTKAVFPDTIRTLILAIHEHVDEYRVVQHSLDHIAVHLRARSDLALTCERIESNFRDLASRLNVCCPKLEFLPFDDHVERTRKFKRVERKFSL